MVPSFRGTELEVLIIEPDDGHYELIRSCLAHRKEIRCQLRRVRDVQKGLWLLNSQDFKIILLGLPPIQSEALEPLSQLVSSRNDIPIIALGMSGDHDLGLEAIQAGAQDFLLKPELSNGNLARAICYTLERQQMMELTLSREERIRAIGQALPDLVFVLDEQGRYIEVITSKENLLYQEAAKVKGKLLSEVFDTQTSGIFMKVIERALLTQETQVLEYSLTVPAGERWFEGRTAQTSLEVEGLRTVVFIARDITERKQADQQLQESEARFRTLFETSPAGVEIDQQGRLLYANPAFERIFGISDLNALIGEPIDFIIAPSDRERVISITSAREAGEKVPETYQFQGQRQDGSTFPVEVTASNLTLSQEKATMAIIHDISERKELERKLLQSEKLAAIGQLGAGVAHELNTPLANISLLADNLIDTTMDEEVASAATQIVDQVQFAAEIVRDLLNYARPESLDLEPLELQDLLEASLNQLNLPEEVKVEQNLEPDLPLLEGDVIRFQEILTNLITNSVAAMEDRELQELSIVARKVGSNVEIRLRDTGKGITQENLERIYDPFFTTKPAGRGTGLGMSIVQRLVQEHRGTINVRSRPEVGTRVTLSFPGFFNGSVKELIVDSTTPSSPRS